jgi:hypothetical protein
LLARGPDAVTQTYRLANKFVPTAMAGVKYRSGDSGTPRSKVGGNLLARGRDAVTQTYRLANKFAPTAMAGRSTEAVIQARRVLR